MSWDFFHIQKLNIRDVSIINIPQYVKRKNKTMMINEWFYFPLSFQDIKIFYYCIYMGVFDTQILT